MMIGLNLRKISYVLPERIETNAQLKIKHPNWNIDEIEKKTGITKRYISKENETSLDLGFLASKNLFQEYQINQNQIDSILFISQSADYALPSSSCILQEKLSLRKDILALDINLGCSGFVNSLAVASSLIKSNMINNCLIVCAETYSKYIDENDRTNKLIFSDASSACLVEKDLNLNSYIGNFCFGCDGSGAEELIVKGSGARNNIEKNKQKLFMNGPAILLFTLNQVPKLLSETLKKNCLELNDIDLFIFHQASKIVLDLLAERIGINRLKMFSNLDSKGNTVSCSIPIALKDAYQENHLFLNQRVLIIGFGVGYSLGATIIKW